MAIRVIRHRIEVAAAAGSAYSGFAGYYAEYDASNASTLQLSGSNLTQWDDVGGSGRNLTVASGTPTSGTATIGGLNAIDGTGSLELDVSDVAQPYTIYVVIDSTVTDGGPTSYIFFDGRVGGSGPLLKQQFNIGVISAGTELQQVTSMNAAAHIVGGVFDSTSSVAFVDANETSGNANTQGLAKINISVGVGPIGHVLIFNAVHDSTARGGVRSALQTQWGTP